nr:hypothetical protein B0A51_16189 [Rachicladosporium sp. CCFEE 5018]
MSELSISSGGNGGQSIGNTLAAPAPVPNSRMPMDTSAASVLLQLHDDAAHKRKGAEYVSSPLGAARASPKARTVRKVPHNGESDSLGDNGDVHTEADQPSTVQSMPRIPLEQQQNTARREEDNDVLHSNTASLEEAPETRLGRLVVAARGLKRKCESLELDITSCRNKLPNVTELANFAEQKFKEAEALVRQAEATRRQAEEAKSKLEDAKEETGKLTAAEEELQQARREFRDVRNQLEID